MSPKIVFATQWLPYPPDVGYRIRHFEMLKALSLAAQVSLVVEGNEAPQTAHVAALHPYCREITFLEHSPESRAWEEHIAQQLRSNMGRLALAVSSHRPVRVRRILRSGANERAFAEMLARHDLAWVVRYSTAEVLGAFGPKVILDMDDIEHKTLWRELRARPGGWGRWFTYTELPKLACYERRLPAKFRSVLVCSDVDRRYLRANNVRVIPNGAHIPPVYDSIGDGRTILFFGVLSYAPNADAAVHFATNVFPLVRAQVQSARFVIGGVNAPPEVARLHGVGGVEVAGFIQDLAGSLAGAAIVVVSLRAGSGTRIKILESMAHGKAVVSTSIGAEGLSVTDGRNIVLRDSPADFAEACVRLLRDEGYRSQLGIDAREFVREHYAWSAVGRSVKGVVEECLEG